MDVLFNSVFAQVGMGAGLATLSGLRAFLPIALFGLFARNQWLSAPDLHGTGFAFLQNPWFIGVFFVLALLEIVADKIPVLNRAQDFVAIPLRIAAGAILFGAALVQRGTLVMVVGMVAGGAIAGASHAAKSVIRPGAAATAAAAGTASPFLSLFEDIAAALGTVLVMLLPVIGIVLLLFLLFLIYRILRRRRSKYKGLRILRD